MYLTRRLDECLGIESERERDITLSTVGSHVISRLKPSSSCAIGAALSALIVNDCHIQNEIHSLAMIRISYVYQNIIIDRNNNHKLRVGRYDCTHGVLSSCNNNFVHYP